jgi:hypothetical protein
MWSTLILIAAISIPVAKADVIITDTINFPASPNATIYPTSGAFTYDQTASLFTSFSVTWDGFIFDLTSSANDPSVTSTTPSCLSGLTGGAASYALLTGACSPNPYGIGITAWEGIVFTGRPYYFNFASDDEPPTILSDIDFVISATTSIIDTTPIQNAGSYGPWTVTKTSVTTPEPGAGALTVFGFLGLWVVCLKSRRKDANSR